MSLTYILIDFENVQPTAVDMSLIRGTDYRVRLFHGPHQNKFDAEMVKALQPLGVQVEYVQCERKGKNALDFHMAFYLGRLVQECEADAAPPGKRATLFVVSKDGGFDTLLGHVRALGFGAARVASVPEALAFGGATDTAVVTEPAAKIAPPPKKAATGKPVTVAKKTPTAKAQPAKKVAKAFTPQPIEAAKPDPWLRTLENLRDHPNNRPTTSTALERHLANLLGKGTPQAVVNALIARLQREGVAVENGKKIEYKIPDGKK
jgi:hypothetical protein